MKEEGDKGLEESLALAKKMEEEETMNEAMKQVEKDEADA
jgi:hypothetical protein